MHVLKSCSIAFSMYSKIPMPQFEWKEKDMKYVISFFPFVGIVIGLISLGWIRLANLYFTSDIFISCIAVVIPLLISGGIHIDGYMDTLDAFHSYQPRERKLEILKDSHIGAFSVIGLVAYYLIYVGVYSEMKDEKAVLIFCLGFYLSRILSGIGVVTFKCAKHDGLLYLFSSTSQEKIVKASLYIQLVLCVGTMLVVSVVMGCAVLGVSLLWMFYYKHRMYKELGGITGDTAGYFVTLCELFIAMILCIW